MGRWLERSRTWYGLAVSTRATGPRRWPRSRRSEPLALGVVSLYRSVLGVRATATGEADCGPHHLTFTLVLVVRGVGGCPVPDATGAKLATQRRRLVCHGAASDKPGPDSSTTADSRPKRGRARARSSTRGSTALSERRLGRPGVHLSGRERRRTKRRPRERTRPARREAVRGGPRPRPNDRVRE